MDKETRKWATKKKFLGLYSRTQKQKLYKEREEIIQRLVKINESISHGRAYTLKEALNKVYNIKPSIKGNHHIGGMVKFPVCLIGRNVKLKLTREKLG